MKEMEGSLVNCDIHVHASNCDSTVSTLLACFNCRMGELSWLLEEGNLRIKSPKGIKKEGQE